MRRAFSFLTVLGRGTAPDGATLRWFPVVGLVLGAAVGGVWWGADRVLPPLVAAGVVVLVDLALTGMLHVDGLADSADGLLPHLPRERRLAVMAEPTAGAFAVAAVAAALLLRAAAFASRPAAVALVAGLWCTSRSVLALVAATQPYARPEGLAARFLGDRLAPVAGASGIVVGVAAATAGAGWAGLAAAGGLLAGSVAVVALARRRLGGFTGDVLGAACVVGETVGLVVATARW